LLLLGGCGQPVKPVCLLHPLLLPYRLLLPLPGWQRLGSSAGWTVQQPLLLPLQTCWWVLLLRLALLLPCP
jgi:hypothetical protein